VTDESYFESLEDRLDDAIALAESARKRGADPKPEVEIPVAKDLADRVENLIGVEGVAERIRALEETEDSREDVALRLAEEFADGEFPPEERDEKAEAAIRTAVALLTEGVVAAPIEGIDGVDLLENDDGTEYLRVEYAGPIRSAGGTAQALSVLIADYVGSSLGVDAYKPRDDEVERYIEEVNLYAEETGLQYTPKDKETRLIIENCPICLDGEPTTEREVSGYRDLERIDTNRGRGGMCLVAAEGIALKAPKIKKYVDALGMDGWDWIDELMHDASSDDEGDDEKEDQEGIKPNRKFLRDLTAGRPIFSHPSRPGGFRLRYARARNTGLAAAGVSPATMVIFDDFLAAGTQIKTERPGKAAGVAPVDGIEGPTVVLSNGEVRRIDTEEEARRVRNGVERIVDIGEIALNYGEFLENNHPLVPGAYTHEWWVQELEDSEADVEGLRRAFDLDDLPAKGAFRLSRKYDVPLHPRYTYLWHDIGDEEYDVLCDAVVRRGEDELVFGVEDDEDTPKEDKEETDDVGVTTVLERLLVPHLQDDEEARVEGDHAYALGECLDVSAEGEDALGKASDAAGVAVRERAPTRVGARMGRPEKSKKREMNPAVHCLFPIGDAGGSQRDIDEAASHAETMRDTVGEINVSAGGRRCPSCGTETYENVCDCGARTEPVLRCPSCEIEVDEGVEECPRCGGETTTVRRFDVRIDEKYRGALDNVGERATYDILKCVKGLTSAKKTPEPLEKGVLRAKHDVSTFKDGTVRYDMTDLPLTSFRPDEIGVSVERLREMGYERDVDGEPLREPEQVVELKPQDVVLSRDSAEYLTRVADFVDDLLEQYYGVEPYHELDGKDELVGELVMGLAPHTSAGVLGRVVGFTDASVGYAHPFFHAAKRRNCFHPDTKMPFLDEEGSLRHETVESFVEERLENTDEDDIRRDDFGTVVADAEGVEVPSLDDDGEMNLKPVEAVSKHPAPEHLVKIKTRSGREIVVTPDHEMQIYDVSEGVTTKRASEITEEDDMMTPRELPVEPSEDEDFEHVDLLEEFVVSDSVENDRLMVKKIGKERLYAIFEDALSDGNGFDVLVDTAEYLGISKKSLSNYVYRDSIPVSLLLELLGSRETLLENVSDDVLLGVKRDTTTVDRYFELNEKVATLVGYYTAEGFTREQETSKGTVHQTTFCGTEQEARDFYVETLREEFGVEPYRENHAKVTVSGRLFHLVFDEVLDAGSGAREKRMPENIFDAPQSVAEAYLSGYFSGDGSVESRRLVVNATTVSEELKRDLTALLTRLGIKARAEEIEPVPLLEHFPEFYAGDDESESATRHVLTVSSDDAVRFHERIGFHLSRKSEALGASVDDTAVSGRRVFDGGGPSDALVESVKSVEYVRSDTDHVYCLTVSDTHSLIVNDLASKQCDGDEDCVTLMSDALLNFSKEYLPDQRGGSVAEDSRLVAFGPDGETRFVTFDELWDELDATVERDGKFEKKTCLSEGWETYAFDDDHCSSPMPIEKAIRYRAGDERVLRVRTQFGRELEVTANHSLFRYDDGIEEVECGDLREGDLVVAPRVLDTRSDSTGRDTIDVADCLNEPYVFVEGSVEEYLEDVWNDSDYGGEARAAFDGGLSYRMSKKKLSLRNLERIGGRASLSLPPVTEQKIGLKGSSTGVRRRIEIDEDFAWLLGVFVAEGTLSTTRPALHNSDEEIVDKVVERAERVLGVEPSVRWSNKAYEVGFPTVFREVLYHLGLGSADHGSYHPSEKSVPKPVLSGDTDVVKSFLRGFLAGDGSETTDDNHTTLRFHTTSEDVKDGVVFLLHRLGIVSNVSERERDEPRHDIYSVTVSGGASDNPLRRVLKDDEKYLPKSLVVSVPDELMRLREMNDGIEGVNTKQAIPKYLKRRDNVSLEKLVEMVEEIEDEAVDLPEEAADCLDSLRTIVDGDLSYLRVKSVEDIDYDGYLYDLQVGGEPVFTANWLYAHNSMDAPLVMTSRIDPTEIDDEAHNVDKVSRYPLSFYEAAGEYAHPKDVNVRIAEDDLETPHAFDGFGHTVEATRIDAGPENSAYKILPSMDEKTTAQLEIGRKTRAVDESDVAERVVESHFLPDLIGNLRAFTQQEFRCLDCNKKFRRPPLSGNCDCGGEVTLTVHKGSVKKYLEVALETGEKYGVSDYTMQRLEQLQRKIDSLFEDDKSRQSGIADFM
jgi:DNA polymerase II large subunit